jgi:cytochrome c heme-lyase
MSSSENSQAVCPVDHKARDAWLEKARQTGEKPPHPIPETKSSPIPIPQDTQPKLLKTRPLSQDREVSTIPRADPSIATTTPNPSSKPSNHEQETGADPKTGNWIYPSEKMFFDAMKRKNYDPQATDMAAIVPIHNAVNEKAWEKIKQWEERFAFVRKANTGCGGPKLYSFSGDSKKMSLKARWFSFLGYTTPFDRHDWVIQRCNGPNVEYIIDFYEGRGSRRQDNGKLNFYLDVRPKINTWEGFKMNLANLINW